MHLDLLRLNLLHKKNELLTIQSKEFKLNPYEQLFSNMNIIDPYKGDWVKYIKTIDNPCYRLVLFKLSDSLSYLDFLKKVSYIQEKIQVNHLEILHENGYMQFKVIKDTLPVIPYRHYKSDKFLIPLGVDLDNEINWWNITKDSHQIVVGTTNSGKSSLVNMEILHIIENKIGYLHLIDLKNGVEFFPYKGCRQVKNFAYTLDAAKQVISYFKEESERRFNLIREKGFRNFEEYKNSNPKASLYREFLIIDEFADLMTQPKRKKDKVHEFDAIAELTVLARKCRAVGLHIILATQRPTADNIPPTLKANCSCIVGFRVINELNSRIVIDEPGLEKLENKHCIALCEGKKIQFRTMYLEQKYLDTVINKNKKINITKPTLEKITCEGVFVGG